MKNKKTKRGFNYVNFKDARGTECSIQMSSNASNECIWIGADKIGLHEFVAYRRPEAWVHRIDVDESTQEHHFVANNRMELTRADVKKLLPILQNFVDSGILTTQTDQPDSMEKSDEDEK